MTMLFWLFRNTDPVRFWTWVGVFIWILAWMMLVAYGAGRMVGKAMAHELTLESGLVFEYDPVCCSDRDCAPMAEPVLQVPSGYAIPHLGLHVPYKDRRLRWSPDGRYHLCTSPFSNKFRCLYVPFEGG